MKKKLLLCAGALIAAQVFSGCYVLRELDWNASKIKNGDKATATLGLQGTGGNTAKVFARGGTPGDGRVFLATFGEGGDGLTFKRPTFDSKDQIGAKEKLTQDDELRDLVFDGGNCQVGIPFRRQGSPPGVLWRTEDDVAGTNKAIESKLKVKAANDSPDDGFAGVIVSGFWTDDGDGVVEDPDTSDDEIGCTGFMTTTLVVNGVNP